nr:MAG TPA: hypothetical protein [Bacteriophage sp.]
MKEKVFTPAQYRHSSSGFNPDTFSFPLYVYSTC